MKFEDLAKKQYDDIANLSILLKNYVDAYRLLIGGASELYNVDIAKKSDVPLVTSPSLSLNFLSTLPVFTSHGIVFVATAKLGRRFTILLKLTLLAFI
jgi:hypothetical protein